MIMGKCAAIFKCAVFIFISAFYITGCTTVAKILNPYESESMCPDGDSGKCASMEQALEESRYSDNPLILTDVIGDTHSRNTDTAERKSDPGYAYRQQLYAEMTQLIREPETPMFIPEKAMRVLILDYTEGNSLYSSRYVYFAAGKTEWVIAPGKKSRLR